MSLSLQNRMRLRRAAVWLSRLVVGATFAIAGWAKAIDPWGFVIKTGEYLAVWDWSLPAELIVAACVAVASIEFCTGVLIAIGAMKRFSVWTAAAFMVLMLPLTLYIAVADPVADCGCFGDFIIVSNWFTFAKNIVLTALIVYLAAYNRSVAGLVPAPVQWLAISVSLLFPFFLAFVGYNTQPVVDFRPFKLGTQMFHPADYGADTYFTYEKNGERRNFTLDNIPDSTWVFVDAEAGGQSEDASCSVFDSDGEEVSEYIVNSEGEQLFLIVPDPNMQFLSRSHFVNSVADYGRKRGVELIAVVGSFGDTLEEWKDWVRPDFDVYSADPVSLKMISRGVASLVMTRDGKIIWKRTLSSLDPELIEDGDDSNVLSEIRPVDDGRIHTTALCIYMASMLIIYLLGQSPKILRLFMPRKS